MVNETLFDLPCSLTTKSPSVSTFFFVLFLILKQPPSENPRPVLLCEADDLREMGEV